MKYNYYTMPEVENIAKAFADFSKQADKLIEDSKKKQEHIQEMYDFLEKDYRVGIITIERLSDFDYPQEEKQLAYDKYINYMREEMARFNLTSSYIEE